MSNAKVAVLKKTEYVNKEEAVAAPATTMPVAAEQVKYANMLLYGAWSGILILAVSFFLYVTGIMSSYMPPQEVSKYWGMKASEYLVATNSPHGWNWLKMAGYGDYLNLIGIAFLGTLTVVGYLILLPAYLKKKDMPYSAIVVTEILVLTLAASGILKVGGH